MGGPLVPTLQDSPVKWETDKQMRSSRSGGKFPVVCVLENTPWRAHGKGLRLELSPEGGRWGQPQAGEETRCDWGSSTWRPVQEGAQHVHGRHRDQVGHGQGPHLGHKGGMAQQKGRRRTHLMLKLQQSWMRRSIYLTATVISWMIVICISFNLHNHPAKPTSQIR